MQYCKQCGANNSSTNKTCQACGAPLTEQLYIYHPAQEHATNSQPKDDTTLWLVLNIFCALCCCQILGIIGAVFAGVAKTSYRQGNIGDAENKLHTSRTLFTVGVVLGLIASAIYLIFRMSAGS